MPAFYYLRLSSEEKKILLERQSNRCFYCGCDLHFKPNYPDDFNHDLQWACVDHKISRFNGGETNIENCVMACRRCNCQKGPRNYEEAA